MGRIDGLRQNQLLGISPPTADAGGERGRRQISSEPLSAPSPLLSPGDASPLTPILPNPFYSHPCSWPPHHPMATSSAV